MPSRDSTRSSSVENGEVPPVMFALFYPCRISAERRYIARHYTVTSVEMRPDELRNVTPLKTDVSQDMV